LIHYVIPPIYFLLLLYKIFSEKSRKRTGQERTFSIFYKWREEKNLKKRPEFKKFLVSGRKIIELRKIFGVF